MATWKERSWRLKFGNISEDTLKEIGFKDKKQALQNLKALSEELVSGCEFLSFFPTFAGALKKTPSPDQALNHFERFISSFFSRQDLYSFFGKASGALEMLLRLFSTSSSLSEALIRNPEYYDWLMDPQVLKNTWSKEMFHNEIDSAIEVLQHWYSKLNALRRFRRRQMLRIGVRDFEGLASLEETVRDISFLAEVCLEWAYRISYRELEEKFGSPRSEDDPREISGFAIMGMGKLGGLELNYSSDIDLIFIYSQEGCTAGGASSAIENHLFFTRLAEKILKALGERTREGYLYRVDMRLRPEGETGPLVRSLDSFESYYASWGQAWERLALIKARFVAGCEEVGKSFIERMSPFVYRKYVEPKIISEVRTIKARIDAEVETRGEQDRDVKLGIGGIREIEFGIQVLQLLYGGRNPLLREKGSLETISRLEKAGLLESDVALRLRESYGFLRKVEHFLQLENERQLHVLPKDLEKLSLLSRRLGYLEKEKFLNDYEGCKKFVHQFYETVFLSPVSPEDSFATFFETGWLTQNQAVLVDSVGFSNRDEAIRNLLSLAKGSDEVNMSNQTLHKVAKAMSQFLEALKKASDPDQALIGFCRFVDAYKARGILFEVLHDEPQMMELLTMVFGLSSFLSNILIKDPDLFDVVSTGSFVHPAVHEEDFDVATEFLGVSDFEKTLLTLRRLKNREVLKIGIRDVLDLSPCMEIVQALSCLAETVLEKAFMVSKSFFEGKHRLRLPPFVVMGLGKLGGRELGYASDLDVLFVSTGDLSREAQVNQFGSLLMESLSRNTEEGFLYKVDPRLRPDGTKGPLVQSIEACRDYYQNASSLWERMALSRARFIVGNEDSGEEVRKIISNFVFEKPITPEDVDELKELREMIYRERCSSLPDGFEIKSGVGGLLDVEFLAQFLLLKHRLCHTGLSQANTLKVLRSLSDTGVLRQEDQGVLVEAYLFYREVENALRLVKDRATDFIPRESQWAIRLQKKMKLEEDPDKFFSKLEHFSKVVRYLYHQYVKY